MRYLGFYCGQIINGFQILPTVMVYWAVIAGKRNYNVQFAWLLWHITIGQIGKRMKEDGILI